MNDFIMQQLRGNRDPKEKAAIIAEYIFNGLPKEVALAARYCVLFHWFDQAVIEALFEETALSQSDVGKIYEQLVALPFIERLPWGQKFQDLTREGLLARYIRTNPEILKKAARLAAPAYERRHGEKKIVAEALFCYTIAGNQQTSRNVLDALQEEAMRHEDWPYLSNLLRIQEEAEQIPFVQPLPLSQQDWILRGSVHQFQDRLKEAIVDYNSAIASNPQNACAYANRGTVYTEQEQYKKAIADYNHAIHLDPTLTQVYINRGMLAKKQGQYASALEDFELALQQDPQNASLWCDKGSMLSELSRYEEALAAYEEALRLDPQNAEIYKGLGAVFHSLGKYEEALAAYEEALRLDPQNGDTYRGKGAVLYELKRYIQASIAYEEASQFDPYTINPSNEQPDSLAFQDLKQQQYIPHEQKNNIKNERLAVETDGHRFTTAQRQKKLRLSFVPGKTSQKPKAKKQRIVNSKMIENIGALVVVACIIFIASLLFHLPSFTRVGSGRLWATTTAQAQATATVQALDKANSFADDFCLALNINKQGAYNMMSIHYRMLHPLPEFQNAPFSTGGSCTHDLPKIANAVYTVILHVKTANYTATIIHDPKSNEALKVDTIQSLPVGIDEANAFADSFCFALSFNQQDAYNMMSRKYLTLHPNERAFEASFGACTHDLPKIANTICTVVLHIGTANHTATIIHDPASNEDLKVDYIQ